VRVRPFFAWYDIWIGVYIDTDNRRIYILPIPCFGLIIDLKYDGGVA
jgi:hypothetical protein